MTNAVPRDRPLIFILTALTAAASLSLCILALALGWFGPYSGAGCGFCETMRPGLIKQPANTWSNLGFIAAGLSMAWSLANGRFASNRNALTQSTFIATFFSCLAVLLGPGSMAMHASGAQLGASIDVLSMYLVAAFLVAYSARRLLHFGSIPFAAVYAAILAGCIWADQQSGRLFHVLTMGNLAFASSLLLTTLLEIYTIFVLRKKHDALWGYGSLGAILLAFFIWNKSRTGNAWCVPDSLIQGHAAWHLLDALSIYCLFRYYVSENEPSVGV